MGILTLPWFYAFWLAQFTNKTLGESGFFIVFDVLFVFLMWPWVIASFVSKNRKLYITVNTLLTIFAILSLFILLGLTLSIGF